MCQLVEGLEVYLVGGAVRDQLLGLQVKDRDWVVVGATPDEMEARGFKSVGHDFPVFLHPATGEEYALARTERKTGPGYRGFQVNTSAEVSLEQDLRRRDLTINAIAQTVDGAFIDPFGGTQDLKRGVLRHVSEAFAEDPVRILRVARFRARFGFEVFPQTMQLMKSLVAAGETDALVAERVWQELRDALGETAPSKFFQTLRECGALARVAPELDRLFGVPQNPKYHPEIDTGLHTMMVLDAATDLTGDTVVRFAALVHDLGKGLTPAELWPHHHDHERTGLPVIEEFCRRLRVPREYRSLALLACETHIKVHLAEELTPSVMLKLLEAIDPFRRPQRLHQVLAVCEADYKGRTGYADRTYRQKEIVESCFEAANAVDTTAIASRFEDGEKIANSIRQARCAAIKTRTPTAQSDTS